MHRNHSLLILFLTLTLSLSIHGQDLLWTAPVPSPIVGGPVLSSSGAVYVACEDGFVRSYDTLGNLTWEVELLKPPVGQILKYQGVLYVPTSEHAIEAIHATGSAMWEFRISPDIIGDAAVSSKGKVAVVAEDTFLYYIGVDGLLLWKTPLAGTPSTGPVIGSDGVIYTACEGAIEGFNQSGHRVWHYPMPGHVVAPLVMGPNGEVIALDENQQLRRISRLDDVNDWRISPVVSTISPIVSWGRVYVILDEGGIKGYNLLTGEEEWTAGIFGGAVPALDSTGYMYVPDLPNESIAVADTDTAAPAEGLPLPANVDLDGEPGNIALMSIMGEGLLAVATRSKTLYCFSVDVGPGSDPWHQYGGTALRQNRRDEAPSLTLAGIQEGETVSGTVEIVADVRDDDPNGLKLRYYLDRVQIFSQDQEPWTFDWNTAGAINGDRVLMAEVSDLAGNKAIESVQVTVQNSPVGPYTFYADDTPYYFQWEQGAESEYRMEFASEDSFNDMVATSRTEQQNWIKTPNWRPSSKKWKKILNIARSRPDSDVAGYWRVIGKRTGSILAGEYIVKAPQPCLPVEPFDGASAANPPLFRWHLVHNKKFQVEFSTSGDFSTGVAVSSKTKNKSWINSDAWSPSQGRWKKIQALGDRVYWRVRCRDSLDRDTYSEVRSLVFPPPGRASASRILPAGLTFLANSSAP